MDLSLNLWTAPFPSQPDSMSGIWEGQLQPQSLSPGNVLEIDKHEAVHDGMLDEISNHETSDPYEESPDQCNQVVVRVRNKPIPRKGHTKSRKGCFSCKKRKIKCQETRPICGNCIKAEITCEYPRAPQQQMLLPSLVNPPQSTPTVFSMADMRLFHHFMVRAYPHLPVGADEIWKLKIPAFAHEVSLRKRQTFTYDY
jgi:hypothetical protein